MMEIVVCCAVAAVGVDFGWQPVAGGGVEYIIQLEPQMLERLKAGEDIFSDLPPRSGNIRGYRITVGTAVLPHHGEPLPAAATPEPQRTATVSGEPPALDGPLPGPVLSPSLTMDRATANHGARRPPAASHQPEAVKPFENQPAGFERAESGAASSPPQGQTEKPTLPKNQGVKQSHEARRPASSDKQAPTSSGKSQKPDDAQMPDSEKPERKSDPVTADTASPSRPSLAMFGLFASLGVNAFLLWVAISQRTRYRALAKMASTA